MKIICYIVIFLLLFIISAKAEDNIKGPYTLDGCAAHLIPMGKTGQGVLSLKCRGKMFQYWYDFRNDKLSLYDHTGKVTTYILRNNNMVRSR